MRQRQPFNHNVLIVRLTKERLGSYLDATGHHKKAAVRLYDWNVLISGALLEDIARFEVVFRNSVDAALVDYCRRMGWRTEWYQDCRLFTKKGCEDIAKARDHANRAGGPERRGKVIAEFNFGFWRFLCSTSYLTSLWVPALASAFPQHPGAPNARAVRADVYDRMTRLHKLRNRIAHHEPIHRRDLVGDFEALVEVAGWMCPDTKNWIVSRSRTVGILGQRP